MRFDQKSSIGKGIGGTEKGEWRWKIKLRRGVAYNDRCDSERRAKLTSVIELQANTFLRLAQLSQPVADSAYPDPLDLYIYEHPLSLPYVLSELEHFVWLP
jgi:hypothetical protein